MPAPLLPRDARVSIATTPTGTPADVGFVTQVQLELSRPEPEIERYLGGRIAIAQDLQPTAEIAVIYDDSDAQQQLLRQAVLAGTQVTVWLSPAGRNAGKPFVRLDRCMVIRAGPEVDAGGTSIRETYRLVSVDGVVTTGTWP